MRPGSRGRLRGEGLRVERWRLSERAVSNAQGRRVTMNPLMTCRSECESRQCGADPGLYCDGRTWLWRRLSIGLDVHARRRVCTPRCTGRTCGPDGCGAQCGSCAAGQPCSTAGRCICTPNCTGRTCGPDGCGGTCGSACGRGFECSRSGICDVVPGSAVITVTDGTVAERTGTGGSWDSLGGAPDPFVCVTYNGRQNCTPEVTDTFAPRWNYALSRGDRWDVDGGRADGVQGS